MQVLTFKSMTARPSRGSVTASRFKVMPDYGDVNRGAVAVAVGDPEQLHQVNDTDTAPGSPEVAVSPCRRSSPKNREYSPWMQVLTFKSMTARPSRGSVAAFQIQGDA